MNTTIEFNDCRITRLDQQSKDDKVQSVLHLQAEIDQDMAKWLGVQTRTPAAANPDFEFRPMAFNLDGKHPFRFQMRTSGPEQHQLDLHGDGAKGFKDV